MKKALDGSAVRTQNKQDSMRRGIIVGTILISCLIAILPLYFALVGGEDHDWSAESTTPAYTSSPEGGVPPLSGQGGVQRQGEIQRDSPDTRYHVPDSVYSPCTVTEAGGKKEMSGAETVSRATHEAKAVSETEMTSGGELGEFQLPCLTDGGGSTHNIKEDVGAKPTIINLWAWWCQPCRQELPILASVADKHPEWAVRGVHTDGRGQAGIDIIEDIFAVQALREEDGTQGDQNARDGGRGSSFVSYQDSDGTVSSLVGLPPLRPISIIYNSDGTRAGVHTGFFTSEQEVEELMKSVQVY